MGIKILMDVHVKTSKETAILVFAGFCLKSDRLQRAVPETELPNSGALPQRDWRPCLLRSEDTWRRPVERLETGLEESSPNRKKWWKKESIPTSHWRKSTFIFLNFKCNIVNIYTFDKGIKHTFFFFANKGFVIIFIIRKMYLLCNLLFNKAYSLQMIN